MNENPILPSTLVERLLKEKQNLALSSLFGKPDLSELRKIAAQLREYDPETYPFAVSY